jgi:hypothetical protein
MSKEFYTGLVIYVIQYLIFSVDSLILTYVLLGFFKMERKKRSFGGFFGDL